MTAENANTDLPLLGLKKDTACFYYDGIYNGSNPAAIPVTGDKTVYACYWSYYW